MEEQKKEKKSYQYVTWVIIGILFCVFIGMRVYTKYLQKQNMEILSKHLDEDPDFLYNRATSLKAERDTKDEVWKDYTCKFGCYFQYPSNFQVEETETGTSHRVRCQAKSDIITMVQMSCTVNSDFELLSEDDKDTRYENGLLDIKASLRDNYSKVIFGSVEDNVKRGNLYGKLISFHAQIQDLPEIDGEVFIAFRKNKLFIYISQVEENGFKDDLDILIASIVVL